MRLSVYKGTVHPWRAWKTGKAYIDLLVYQQKQHIVHTQRVGRARRMCGNELWRSGPSPNLKGAAASAASGHGQGVECGHG